MVLNWVVNRAQAGTRLDVFLTSQVAGLSRSMASRLIHAGAVEVKGRLAKPGLELQAGNEVGYSPPAPTAVETAPEALPLEIMYQDADLAVINKSAGLVTHPAVGHWQGTLVNALLYHLNALSGIGGKIRPGIVHRLDKETSGLLLVAKNDQAHQILSRAIQAREVKRIYDALVWGQPEDEVFSIETQMGRDPRERKRFAVLAQGGKRTLTRVRVQERFRDFSLWEVSLETGRTHQIRVHCHYLKHPVVGDKLYAKRSEAATLAKLGLESPSRHLLHARKLHFIHPTSRREMEFHAPWPEDMARFIQSLRRMNPKS